MNRGKKTKLTPPVDARKILYAFMFTCFVFACWVFVHVSSPRNPEKNLRHFLLTAPCINVIIVLNFVGML